MRVFIGADILRPWGIVQSHCCGFSRMTQNKLKKTLPIIPFYNTLNLDTANSKDAFSLAEQNELIPLILSRIDGLELFLQEYVVDVRYLRKLTTADNNLNNQTP